MQQSLIVNGKEFLTASAAGRQFGYTRDYILLLAREKKILGEKIQNKWYVDPDSVEAFCRSAKQHQAERKEYLRIERQREFKESISSRISKKSHYKKNVFYKIGALSFVFVSVIVVGYLSFFALQAKHIPLSAATVVAEDSFLKRLAFLFYEVMTPDHVLETYSVNHQIDTVRQGSSTVAFDFSSVSSSHDSEETPLVAIPTDTLTPGDEHSLVAAFSDKVTVIPDSEDPRTGIVIPQFEDGSGKSYRFFMITEGDSSRDN